MKKLLLLFVSTLLLLSRSAVKAGGVASEIAVMAGEVASEAVITEELTAGSDEKPGALLPRRGVSILGDSYSTYEGFVRPDSNICWYRRVPRTDRTDVSDVKQTWWHLLLSENDLRLEVNNSFSGSTISHRGYHGNDYRDRSFLTRLENLGSPDIILVFGGTNDSWAGVECGEYDENGDPYTFRPALAATLAGLRDHYPGTQIVCIVNDGLRTDITESITTLAERYGAVCVMLEGVDKQQGHPTVKGMRQIADQVAAALRSNNLL